jgi:hypothetical protein
MAGRLVTRRYDGGVGKLCDSRLGVSRPFVTRPPTLLLYFRPGANIKERYLSSVYTRMADVYKFVKKKKVLKS